jgi:membrane fusion protein (multidrug efflux system)
MAPWVREGQVAEVTLEAYADRTFKGRVWRISPTVDQAKRTFVVEALIDNPSGELKPGSYARAKLPTNRTDEIKILPARAINYVFGSNKAYVVRGGVIDAREVKLGDRFDEDVEIISGVEDGEKVAVTQLTKLDTGTKVAVAEGERKVADKRAD